ncbi:tubulin-specific chaperone E [Microplitis demolitor]|uniref:tubulin-specific chaperone E n=1 Tax=Microplitis demolitor TaxID=69319 RepID=UPI0004CCC68B|nr:tubulin-specific chaperone E [Microplitis demolitor]
MVGTGDVCHEIGDRIDCDGHPGTVCYIGPVVDTNGLWLGIDWDDPARGKHNGTYHDIEYFKTRYPTSGSFVRPGKVKTGISCPESIRRRYGLVDDELAGVDRDKLSSLKREINAPFLEMVGFSKVNKKQSAFDQLTVICLREQLISSAGVPGELQKLCPNLRELDISKNLINSWKIVADICSQLTKLERLDVSENLLPTKIDDDLSNAFINVNQLIMTRMNYDWSDIEWCTSLFPALRILYVPFNYASTLTEPPVNSNLHQLVDLSLEGNGISSWDEVLKLGNLLSLENLNLNSNKIQRIRFTCDNAMGKTKMFPALRQLHLSKNCINEWRSISELEKLINLEDLKLRDNPVFDNDKHETARQLIIARISNLKWLNSIEINREERKGAEYDYLKAFATEWKQLNPDDDKIVESRRKEFMENHPRYLPLIEKYGAVEISTSKVGGEMKSDVITVEFVSTNVESKVKNVKRKLLKDMDVQKLTGLVQRMFRIAGKIPKLSLIQSNRPKDEIPLDKPLQQLSYYSIQDGDQILVRW